ncbi:MAG: hypothetical protein AOA65_0783 [Candidatus Bathyarchaeota archaeon BA1]|nr:MAG: hypothetical protein AOA65_0783 [Candidatus Bathyarchaeota archaeon BA1]
MPQLLLIKEKPEVFAMAIDTDGWITRHRLRKAVRINRVYRYVYDIAEVGFSTEHFGLTKKIADMMCIGIIPKPARPPRHPQPMFEVRVRGSRAIRAICLMRPYLVKWTSEADKILRLYRRRPMIPRALVPPLRALFY